MSSNTCHTVVFSNKAYNAIVNESFRKDPLETGGILLGHVLDNGVWIVMEVLPPGWSSVFEYAYFEYDEEFVNYLAQSVATEYENELNLLGLWHRHPGSMDHFSGTDDETNSTFACLQPYGAISGLVNIDPDFRLTMYHVDHPLKYEQTEIEVGDDLIPENFFRLKHFPAKGMHPSLDNNIVKGEKKVYKKSNKNTGKQQYSVLSAKTLFLLICAFSLCSCLFLSYAYKKLKGTDDIQALHKVVYSDYDGLSVPEFLKVDFTKIDSMLRRDSVPHKDSTLAGTLLLGSIVSDSLTGAATLQTDSGGVDKLLPDSVVAAATTVGNKFQAQEESLKMGIWLIACAFVLSILCLFVLFVSKFSLEKEWLVVLIALLFSFAIVYIIGYLKTELAIISVIIISCLFLLTSLIAYIVLLYAEQIRFFVNEKLLKKKTNNKKTDKSARYWFQKYPDLYNKEEELIIHNFPTAEKNIESGLLSFFISTRKKIAGYAAPLSFQIVYPVDYRKTPGTIKVYFISPELKMLRLGNANLPGIAVDEAGEYYLDVSGNIPENRMSGLEVIRAIYKWVDTYNDFVTG